MKLEIIIGRRNRGAIARDLRIQLITLLEKLNASNECFIYTNKRRVTDIKEKESQDSGNYTTMYIRTYIPDPLEFYAELSRAGYTIVDSKLSEGERK